MAVLRAAQYVSEHGLTDVEIITDSMAATNQLSNKAGGGPRRDGGSASELPALAHTARA
jgi:ribonuclease HI